MFRNIFQQLLLPAVFWLLLFAFLKIPFLLFHFEKVNQEGFFENIRSFYYGFKLDISTASYFLILPYLAFLFQSFFRKKIFIDKFNWGFTILILIFTSFVSIIDLQLYNDWDTKLNYKALSFLTRPADILGSLENSVKWKLLFYFLLQTSLLIAIYHFVFFKKYNPAKTNRLRLSIALIVAPFLIVIGLRGGFQEIPINQSSAYFSKNQTLNYAAVNSNWNLIHSILENRIYFDKNPYVYMEDETAREIVKKLYETPNDTTVNFLKKKNPNIVMLVLEGWSANVIGVFGGEKLSPNLSELAFKGISFPNIYANGHRTDQGLVAILGGFPAQPVTTIVSQYDKFRNLPSFSKKLGQRGYRHSFVFGGDPGFGNFKTYLVFNEFEKIVTENDFPKKLASAKLGVPDEFVFQRHLEILKNEKEPFFSILLTQSTHEPFDIPAKKKYGSATAKDAYLSAIAYADSCIGAYFKQAQHEAWYKNTLFIIVADHGQRHPYQAYISDPARYRIPLIFYGNVVEENYRTSKILKIGSQTDISKTILNQLNFETGEFPWSKDLMNPHSSEFAIYTFVDGFGWVLPSSNFSYENRFQKFNHKKIGNLDEERDVILQGQAYMQTVFNAYLEF